MIHPPRRTRGGGAPGGDPGRPGGGGWNEWNHPGGAQPPNHPGRRQGIRIAGFPVRLTPGGYLLATLAVVIGAITLPTAAPGWPVLAYLAATAAAVAGLLASLAVHEIAHAIAARRHGLTVAEIPLGFTGGAGHGGHEFATARALGRVAAAGPAASLAAAAVSAGAWAGLSALGAGRLVLVVAALGVWINALLTVVSLLPGPGLDGGRIVHALAWARSGDRAHAAVTAARIGQFTGALLIAGGVALLALGYLDGIWAGLMGLVMAGSSRARAREVSAITALAGMRVGDLLAPAPPLVAAGWQPVQAFLDGNSADGPVTETRWPAGSGATAFPVRDFDGAPAGVVTVSQLAAVPPERRAAIRVGDIATPMGHVVTTTPGEPLGRLMSRLSVRPSIPAALHTAGHALVLGADGAPLGVLTPADFARAGGARTARGRTVHAGRQAP